MSSLFWGRLFRRGYLFWALPVFFILGCAAPQKSAEDSFFDQWRELAQESRGFSPPPKETKVDVTDIFTTLDDVSEEREPARPLPGNNVTMRMRDVDVRIVLRALATAADKNIIMSDSVQGNMSLNINNSPWDQTFLGVLRTQSLTYNWEGNMLRVMSIDDMRRDIEVEHVKNERAAAYAEARRFERLQTSVVRVRYSNAEMLKANLERFLTTDRDGNIRGSVEVDEHNNALIIQAVADDTRRMIRLLENLDQPRPQVLLKAHIVETTQDTARELGVQWGGRYRSGVIARGNERFFIGEDSSISFPAEFNDGPGATLDLLYGVMGGNILEFQLSALQSQGKLNILSSPSITTLDNQMAFTENGERIPFVSRDGDGDPEVKFEDAVLRLEITPNIIDEEYLKLGVRVKKDEVDTSRDVLGNPFIIKKQTETNLVVADGETIVISGLTRERSSIGNEGVPGLKDIPGLGALFRRDYRGQFMEEVLIFITPHILPYRTVDDR
ncbi:type IV pilus secretin PilQ [Desulfonatronovibrio hydrogenovorans]|uniref:type IV pilus secretin PilQ n=1 Tax=Desulfonatronovibrio hydrogenovorans TaxID=53245 RepID=UPI000AF2FECE